MNVYKPTGEKVENWPQWVQRLTNENIVLKRRVAELEKQVMEEQARNAKRKCHRDTIRSFGNVTGERYPNQLQNYRGAT